MTSAIRPNSASERAYQGLRHQILRGDFAPEAPLRPQELATAAGVSLAAVREALLRLVGEGFADRLPNRGFAVPRADAERWISIAQARSLVEPEMLRLSIALGDIDWEAEVRAAHHSLSRTEFLDPATGDISDNWDDAHHRFHATLLMACRNDFLLDTFERLWIAGTLARRWSVTFDPTRDAAAEHAALETAVLARRPDDAAQLLADHILGTVAALGGTVMTDSKGA